MYITNFFLFFIFPFNSFLNVITSQGTFQPGLQFDQETLDFGVVQMGTTSEMVATITNNGIKSVPWTMKINAQKVEHCTNKLLTGKSLRGNQNSDLFKIFPKSGTKTINNCEIYSFTWNFHSQQMHLSKMCDKNILISC